MDGQHYHLQPGDIHVAFKGDGPTVSFALWGQFVKFDTSSGGNSRLGYDVMVQSGLQKAAVDAGK